MGKELILNEENLKKALGVFGISNALTKANPFTADLQKGLNNEGDSLNKEDASKVIQKALGFSSEDLEKALNISKSISDFNTTWGTKTEEFSKGLGIIGGKFTDLEKSLNEKLEAKDELIKGLKEELKTLSEKVETIGNASPLRKSIANTTFAERNFVNNDLQKGNPNEGKKVLSLSKNTDVIRKAIELGLDGELKKGINNGPFMIGAEHFDAYKNITPEIKTALEKEGFVIEA